MPRKALGFWSIVALVIGTQLGNGIFFLPQKLAPFGAWSLFSWFITGGAVIAMALVLAMLASHFPKTGGPHVYVYEAFGKKAAYYVAWSYWAIAWLSPAPDIILAAASLEVLLGPWPAWVRLCVEVLVLSTIVGTSFVSMNFSRKIEFTMSLLKLVPLVCIPIVGIYCWDATKIQFPQGVSPYKAIGSSCLLVVWGFLGFEAGTTPGGEVQNARRNIPRGLVVGTLIVMTVYFLHAWVAMGHLSPQGMGGDSYGNFAFLHHVVGKKWGSVMSLLTAIICLGMLQSWALVTGQIGVGAAEEGLFPQAFARKNKHHCPTFGIGVIALLLLGVIFLLRYQFTSQKLFLLIEFCSATYLFVCMAFLMAAQWLMWKKRIPSRPLMWGLSTIGIIFCLWCAQMLIYSNPWYIPGVLAIPCVGFLMHRFGGWGREENV